MLGMRRLLIRVSPALQLTRVTTAFAAVANVWFVILWTRAMGSAAGGGVEPGIGSVHTAPLWVLLAGGAANALGLFAYATALNDVLDWRRDQALRPGRPLPSGRMSMETAVTLVVVTLGVAVLGATVLGIAAVVLTMLVAGAILAFNGAGRFVPAVGLVMLGLIYAGQMVVPNLNLRFVWPVWLVMTHALGVAAMVHVVGRKVPTVSGRAAAASVAGWAFWSVVILGFGYARGGVGSGDGGVLRGDLWPDWIRPWAWVGPTTLAGLFALLCWRRVHTLGPGTRAADKIARYGALWLALYACAWLVGQRLWPEAAILGGLTLAGFLGMTILREAFALIEHPVEYRR